MKENTSFKKMTLLSATLLSATCMVGSGWLFSAQLTAKGAGNWAFLAWIMAAIVAFLLSYCLMKIVSIYPVRGAITRASSLSHNNIFAMPFAFANWLCISSMIATEASATAQYLAGTKTMNWLMSNNTLTLEGDLFTSFILCLYLLVNFYGVKLLARINNAITAFKIIVPILIVVIFTVYAIQHNSNNVSLLNSSILNNHYGFVSALTTMVSGGLIYAFNGFQVTIAYASEIKNPKRNIPLAIIFSLTLVLILYLSLQYAFMQSVPHDYLVKKGGWVGLDFESPLLQLATMLGLGYLSILLIIDSIISPSATGYTYLGSTSRMLYSMASEKQMPSFFAKITPKVNVSRRSLIANFIFANIFVYFSDSWANSLIILTAYQIIAYMAAPVSMGAISPKTRAFGAVVFAILVYLLNTISLSVNIEMSISIIILVVIFGLTQIKRVGFKNLLRLNLPFIIFIIVISSINRPSIEIILGIIFYLCVTSKKYVAFCKETADKSIIIVD